MLTICYGLNCVPSKYVCWSASPQCNGFWRWGLWEAIRFRWGDEGGTLMMGLMTLDEEEERDVFQHMHQGKTMWTHSEKENICKPKRVTSWRSKLSSIWILDFLASRMVRNKCLLSITFSHSTMNGLRCCLSFYS